MKNNLLQFVVTALGATVVIWIYQIILDGFMLTLLVDDCIDFGLPLFIALLLSKAIGQQGRNVIEGYAYVALYAWLIWVVLDAALNITEQTRFGMKSSWQAIVIPTGFLVAIPGMWLSAGLWKTFGQRKTKQGAPPA